jgi:alkylated DNA repair dioxygenase AlkB
MPKQSDLFGAQFPDGFRYQDDVISSAEEQRYAAQFAKLPFAPFEFHGYLGKRRIVSYGWRYEYSGAGRLKESTAIPSFLLPLRKTAAAFAQIAEDSLQQILVTEYAPGAGIGWHRDKPMFEDVVALSFLAPCTLRFRKRDGTAWKRISVEAKPRSAYLLHGPSRREWEHSVPPVEALRYSVTFRNFTDDI